MRIVLISLAVLVMMAAGVAGYVLFATLAGDGMQQNNVAAESDDAPDTAAGTAAVPDAGSAASAHGQPSETAELSAARLSGRTVGPDAPLRFGMPADCVIGRNCVIQNYADMAAGAEYTDPLCGSLSYDGHEGTDIRLPSHREMEDGVAVIAAADGTVLRVRDGMPDVNFRLVGREAVTRLGLGNAVVISHRDGYRTAYGHLKRGSVVVKPGDEVRAGDTLGEIGLSGLTEFPHLHFEVQKDGAAIDPFTGRAPGSGCGPGAAPLWTEEASALLRPIPTLIIRIGFFDAPVNRAAMEYDLLAMAGPLDGAAGDLLLHVYIAGLQSGDTARFQIIGPEGETVMVGDHLVETDSAVQVLRGGVADRPTPFPPGTYRGIFKLMRPGPDGALREVAGAEAETRIE